MLPGITGWGPACILATLRTTFLGWVTVCSWNNPNDMNVLLADISASDWSWGYSFTIWGPTLLMIGLAYMFYGSARDRYSGLKRELWSYTPCLYFVPFIVISVLSCGLGAVAVMYRASYYGGWTNWHTAAIFLIVSQYGGHVATTVLLGWCNSNGFWCGCETGGCTTGGRQWISKHGFNFPVLQVVNVIVLVLQGATMGIGGVMVNTILVGITTPAMFLTIWNIYQVGMLWNINGGNFECEQRQRVNFIPRYTPFMPGSGGNKWGNNHYD